MGKYDPLAHHFRRLTGSSWHATFEQLERILSFRLPASARAYPAWWAWLDAGWKTRDLNLAGGRVLFVHEAAAVGLPTAQKQSSPSAGGGGPPGVQQTFDWDTADTVEAQLRFTWTPIGRVTLDAGGKLCFPKAQAVPAIYRFRIRQGSMEKRYVGQTENLARRFGNYRNIGPTQATNIRLNAEFIQALAAGAEISVAAVTKGASVDRGDGPVEADMQSLSVRCLLEDAAIVMSGAVEIESLNRSEATSKK
jgi:hypothetical protein